MTSRDHTTLRDQQIFALTEVPQDAVIRCLQVIGETGMRDVLVHAYDRVALEAVWIPLREQLPPLKAQIEALLEE